MSLPQRDANVRIGPLESKAVPEAAIATASMEPRTLPVHWLHLIHWRGDGPAWTCAVEGRVVAATDAVHSLPLKGGGLGRGSFLLRESLQQRRLRRDLTPTRRLRRIRVFPNSAILRILPKSETSDFGWPTSPFQGEVRKKLSPPPRGPGSDRPVLDARQHLAAHDSYSYSTGSVISCASGRR
jgi:hypothetical protein